MFTRRAISYAQKKDEFRLKNKRQANDVEFFEICHLTKEDSYVENTSKDFMDRANQEISKKILELGIGPTDFDKRSVIEREVMIDLMGPNKPGRARGHGAGVTKSQVTDLSYDLRRMRGGNFANQSQVSTLLVQVESQRQQIDAQNKRIESQNKIIESLGQIVNDFRGELRLFQSVFQDNYIARMGQNGPDREAGRMSLGNMRFDQVGATH